MFVISLTAVCIMILAKSFITYDYRSVHHCASHIYSFFWSSDTTRREYYLPTGVQTIRPDG
jgi:hypothetical protein